MIKLKPPKKPKFFKDNSKIQKFLKKSKLKTPKKP